MMSPSLLTFSILFLIMLGLVFGSFGYVLVLRMPKEQSINGRSRCPDCNHVLSPLDLIPILSYVCLGGRCRYCKQAISPVYPLVEIASAALFVLAGVAASFALVPSLFLGLSFWCMLTIAIVDAQTQMIPDMLTVVLGVAAVAYQLTIGHPPLGVGQAVGWSGAGLGILFFGAQWILSRGMWVGSGDILLAVSLGLLLGSWRSMLVALMAAYIIGALVVSVFLGLGKLKRNQHIAFGPFLVTGTFVAFFFAESIVSVMVPI